MAHLPHDARTCAVELSGRLYQRQRKFHVAQSVVFSFLLGRGGLRCWVCARSLYCWLPALALVSAVRFEGVCVRIIIATHEAERALHTIDD